MGAVECSQNNLRITANETDRQRPDLDNKNNLSAMRKDML